MQSVTLPANLDQMRMVHQPVERRRNGRFDVGIVEARS